ncbi:MAG: hypothetical protein KDA33_10665, partial [Phycisphaerales bacterium]|nr:hypothetical protein [Phycisphaerales bacterium]
NGVPDAEELSGNDCNANGVLDMCELDTLHAVANLATGADSNPEARPSFDIEGDLIAIGEPLGSAGGGNGNGLVRIFRRSGGVWAPETTLPGPEFSSRFGADVDVSGNRVAIAAPGFDQDRGKVFIYRFDSDGGTWVEEAGIEGAEAPFSVRFGRAIALDGRRLVISREPYARRFASDFYDLESGAWTFRLSRYDMSPLMPPDARPPPALALSEGVLVAFETVPNPPFGDGGYVTLLELDGGAWNRVGRFIVNGGIHFPSLVDGIEITSNRVVVAIGGFTVAAFLRTAEGWTREATFFASDLPPGYAFGRWSAHQGERVFIGATVSNTPSLVEIDFSQDPPALLPMDAWTGVVEQGVFSGSDFGYLDESSRPSLHMVALTADCDNDGALDECELAAGAADVDNDRVPDSCEMDCNQDGVPDDRQLDDGDCNSNGVLDECDVNASDPDGDGLVISDCNNNGIPDSCEPGGGACNDGDPCTINDFC